MSDDNVQTVERLIDGLNAKNVGVMDEVFTEDAVMEWPQSRERIRGAAVRRAVYARMEVLPTITPRRLISAPDLVIAEAHLDYEGDGYDCVFVFEMRGGRISKETAYWATPFEPPAWRAALVERM
jgi:ketosteroid isomerase-like protein